MKLLVVSSCTGEKDVRDCPSLLKEADFDDPAALLHREVELARWALPAARLYTGWQHRYTMMGVNAIRQRFGSAACALKIVSAGYGLVSEDRSLAPYEATFKHRRPRWISKRAHAHQSAIRGVLQRFSIADTLSFAGDCNTPADVSSEPKVTAFFIEMLVQKGKTMNTAFRATLLCLSLLTVAYCQEDASEGAAVRPFAAIHGSDIDHVSLQNGGLAVDIPVASYPQRGGKLKLDLHLYYENRGFYTATLCEPNCITYTNWNGSGFSLRDMQNVVPYATSVGNLFAVGCDKSGCPALSFGEYAVQTMEGAIHRVGIVGSQWKTVDGTGFNWNSTAGIITDPDGIQTSVQPLTSGEGPVPCPVVSGVGSQFSMDCEATSRQDPNGNKISFSSTSGFTDTLGRSIPNPAATSGSGCVGSLPTTAAYIWNLPGPNGGTSPVTLCYATSFITLTHSGFGGFGTNNVNEQMLQSVLLPDGKSWVFQYSTDGNLNLTQITYPTGATINYTWTGQQLCSSTTSASVSVKSRTVNLNDGSTPPAVWNYSYVASGAWAGGSGPPLVTTTVSNLQGKEIHVATGLGNSCSIYETQAQTYSSAGALLKTVNTTYSYGTAAAYPDGALTSVLPASVTTVWPSGQTSKTTMSYDSGFPFTSPDPSLKGTWTAIYGRLVQEQEYDYGGTLLSTTKTSYAWQSPSPNYAGYFSNNLLNLPYSVQVLNGGGTQVAYTYSGYDESQLQTSGISEQKVPGEGFPGNQTSVHSWLNGNATATSSCPVSVSNGYLVSNNAYYDTGMLQKKTDPCSQPTTYQYSSSYFGALPTSITNALGQTTTITYDLNTAHVASTQDPNSQNTTYTYDVMGRPVLITYPDGGYTSHCYTDLGAATWYATCTQVSSPPYSVVDSKVIYKGVDIAGHSTPPTIETTTTVFDGLGRVAQTQLNSDPIGTDYVDITHDILGRNSTMSNPHRSGSSSTDGTTTTNYDALRRVTSVVEQDGSTVATNNLGFPCTTVTDEAGNTRQSCVDSLGRMTSVLENSNLSTTYTYDTLGDLLGVLQNGSRARTFSYDSLSRLTSAVNPESGKILYAYDADGNVVTRTAPMPNQIGTATVTTAYLYDSLNRLTNKSYSDGTTVSDVYSYDVAPAWASWLSNVIGRMANSGNQDNGQNGTSATATAYSYDPMGRVAIEVMQTPSVAPYGFFLSYAYDLVGNVYTNSLSCASNSFSGCTPQFQTGTSLTFTRDGSNRLTSITSSLDDSGHPPALYTVDPSLGYWPTGALRKAQFGNTLTESAAFNSRLQPCRISVNSTGFNFSTCVDNIPSSNVLDLVTGYTAGANNGNVTYWAAAGQQTFNRTYTYDPENRLQSMSDSATNQHCQGMSWTIDAWGNMTNQTGTKGTCYTLSASVGANNRLTGGYLYDAAGNMTYDGFHHYTYDAENHIIAVDSGATTYVYNENGLRVRKTTGASFKEYIYGSNDQVQAEWNGTDPFQYVYAGSKLVAQYTNTTTQFIHQDHLGSTRLVTGVGMGVVDSMDYLPFGQQNTGASATTHKFTGKERDPESGLDNFDARYLGSSLGRFMSPDPAGLLAQKPSYPQSWNLYAYAMNNPLIIIDPTGLDCVYANDSGNGVESIDHNSNSGECGQNGGSWAPGYVDENWAHFNNSTGMFQVGSFNGAGNNATVDYTMFEPGAQTQFNGDESSCLSGCAGFSLANANWLQSQLVGNSMLGGLDGYIQFLTGRETPLQGGPLIKLAAGPLDPSKDHWAGPGGMGPPDGRGDWAASVHDYNFSTNDIKVSSYFNPTLSLTTSRALIKSNNTLMRNAGGVQSVKMFLFFGPSNALQWYANSWK
jgi:RHS repeat-associated protein